MPSARLGPHHSREVGGGADDAERTFVPTLHLTREEALPLACVSEAALRRNGPLLRASSASVTVLACANTRVASSWTAA